MNKFWKWMKEKGYGEIEDLGHRVRYIITPQGYAIEDFQKQMLIGYMIEYLAGCGIFFEMIGDEKNRTSFEFIGSYYDRLQNEIKNIKRGDV